MFNPFLNEMKILQLYAYIYENSVKNGDYFIRHFVAFIMMFGKVMITSLDCTAAKCFSAIFKFKLALQLIMNNDNYDHSCATTPTGGNQ